MSRAIGFQPQFHQLILGGLKPFTLRVAGKARPPRITEPLTFTGGRGKPTFARAVCAYRATVVFSPLGLHRVHTISFVPDGGETIWRLFNAAEDGATQTARHLAKIAELDGFDTWADLADWHMKHGQVIDGRCWREAIGWDPAGVEAVAP